MGRAMAHGEATAALRFATNALWLVGVGLGVLMVALRVELARLGGDPLQAWVFIAVALVTVIYAFLGRLLVSRRPRQLVGWIFLATPIAVNLVFLGFSTIDWANRTGNLDAPFVAFIGPIAAAMLPIAIVLAFPLLAIVFPDGKLPGPRWRWPVGIVSSPRSAHRLGVLFRARRPTRAVTRPGRPARRDGVPGQVGLHAGRHRRRRRPRRPRHRRPRQARAHPTSDASSRGSWAPSWS